MNPRYLAYCRCFKNNPEEQLAADRRDYPGGCMAGFMIWIQEQWNEFERLHDHIRRRRTMSLGDVGDDRGIWRMEHADAFDVWLEATYPGRKVTSAYG